MYLAQVARQEGWSCPALPAGGHLFYVEDNRTRDLSQALLFQDTSFCSQVLGSKQEGLGKGQCDEGYAVSPQDLTGVLPWPQLLLLPHLLLHPPAPCASSPAPPLAVGVGLGCNRTTLCSLSSPARRVSLTLLGFHEDQVHQYMTHGKHSGDRYFC